MNMMKENFMPQQLSQEVLLDINANPLAVGRHIADDLLVAAVADQSIRAAGRADGRRIRGLGGDVVVVVGFLDSHYLVVWEVQDICWHDKKGI